MEPIPMSSLSFRPAADGHLNPLLLPIQLPYLMVDRIITRVESVLQLTTADRVRPILVVGSLDVATRKSGRGVVSRCNAWLWC